MKQLLQWLDRQDLLLDVRCNSRDELFQRIGEHFAARFALPIDSVVNGLSERESLFSTAIGQGVAIPHARIKGVKEPLIVFLRLAVPIGFAAPDNEPVDLVFALIVPHHANETHLEVLAEIADFFHEPAARKALMAASSADDVQRQLALY